MSVVPDSALPPGPVPGGSQPQPGTRWAHFDRWWLLLLAVLVLIVVMIVAAPVPFAQIFAFVQDGIIVTLRLTVVSFFFILVVGMLGGLSRVSSSKVLNAVASVYVEVVRGIPVLVWLLWIWYALPQLRDSLAAWVTTFSPSIGAQLGSAQIPPEVAAVIGFTVAYGAYMTEVFRAGIQSIAKGQMEAARSLGLNYIQAMRYVILPQAIRVILPPMGNEFVTLLKDSSLVSILAVSDLTRRGREFVSRSFLSFDTFTMVALIYLVMTLFFTRVSSALERRLSVEKR
jgi:polar amino acid transport system permease protein